MSKQQSFKSLWIIGPKTTVKKKITYWPRTGLCQTDYNSNNARRSKELTPIWRMPYNLPHRTPHSTKSSYQSVEVLLSTQEGSCNDNGNAVDAFSPSSSESSLVSPMQTSIHDNDLSSNSKSKAKRGRKGIINEKRWRSDEIM